MGAISDQADDAWREFNTDDIPATGEHEPVKSEIRAVFDTIEEAISAFVASGAVAVAYATRAALFADLAWIANKLGLVYNDPTPLYNGVYVKSGGSGAGAWTITTIPYSSSLAAVEAAVQPLVDEAEGFRDEAEVFRDEAQAAANSIIDATGEIETDENSTLAIAVIDDDGWIAWGIDDTGAQIGFTGSVEASSYPAPGDNAAPVGSINGAFLYGQSLSNGYGNGGSPILSTSQPFANLMFPGGVADASAYTSFVPLVSVTVGNHGETIGPGLADSVSDRLAPNAYVFLVNGEGADATAIAGLVKGQAPFTNLIASVTAAKAEADANFEAYLQQSLHFLQGESDDIADTPVATYKAALLDLFDDFIIDAASAAGQSHNPVCFFDQPHSWTYSNTTPLAAIAMYQVARDYPEHILVGPKYFLPYIDGTHLTAQGYRRQGEYHGKAYFQTVILGTPFVPLMPTEVKKYGPRVVIAKFNVPVGPLVLDNLTVTDPTAGDYGFEINDSGGAVGISAVELIGADSVKFTLSEDLTSSPKLRYAYTGIASALGGPTTGPRGCLRDSDPALSYYRDEENNRYGLQNWCVTFEEDIV